MYNKGSLRILPAYRLKKGIEQYGGPTASHIYTNTDEGKNLIKNIIWKHENADGEMNVLNVGFLVGCRCISRGDFKSSKLKLQIFLLQSICSYIHH
jgi:hypothetical protein